MPGAGILEKNKKMEQELVILVDEYDNELGVMEKQEAHVKALLHRAFSILIFNSKGELLLQQRAVNKYHSAGLWTNTCCSHPRPGETTEQSAHRRLQEEMGFDCELILQKKFIYKTTFSNGLSEHELDYVFTGIYDETPAFNPEEVKNIKWMSPTHLSEDLLVQPDTYTEWFKIIMDNYLHPDLGA